MDIYGLLVKVHAEFHHIQLLKTILWGIQSSTIAPWLGLVGDAGRSAEMLRRGHANPNHLHPLTIHWLWEASFNMFYPLTL